MLDATLLGAGSNLDYDEKSGNILFGDIKIATAKSEFMPFIQSGLVIINDLYNDRKEWDKINAIVNCLRELIVWL